MTISPHPYSLRQLQYAAAVAETLSFRKAAQLCRVSQPSLSAQLAALESALGNKLFERSRARVVPTPAGAALLERIRPLLQSADDLLVFARSKEDPFKGTLRLGVIPTVSPYLLPRVARPLRKSYPELTVRWIEEKTPVLVELLEAGRLEAALMALEAPLPRMSHEHLVDDEFLLAAAPNHPLMLKKGPAKTSDLADAEVLLLDDGHCLRDQALAVCSHAGANELEFRATSLPTLAQMVAAGNGVTLLPRLSIDTEARRASLSVRPFANPAPKRTLALIWRPQSPLEPALKKLAATLRDALVAR